MGSDTDQLVSDREATAAAIAVREGRGQPADYLMLGWYQLDRGDRRGGEALFREALVHDSRHAGAHLSLASVLRTSGALKDAAQHCDAVIAADPANPDAWYERGMVMLEGGVPDEASICLGKVLEIDSRHAGALGMMALIAARAGKADAASSAGAAALALQPGNTSARRALSMVAIEAGDHPAALAHLEHALENLSRPGSERISILTLIGETHDRAGAPRLAENAYRQANADFVADNVERYQLRGANADRIGGLCRGFQKAIAAHAPAWSGASRSALSRPSPVFVLGHPRSGNTLLENILAMVPGAIALEERPTLRAAEERFWSETGMVDLAKASDPELAVLRSAYYQAVALNGGNPDAALLVDMDPLKSLRLPIIARLFPRARVLLVRRDPRDIVWSCYRTHFALTNAALDFATLEGAARHYAATMDFVETVRAAVPLAVHVVRYEDLVASFDETTRAIADFLAIPWQEDFRRFDRAAKLRGVTTASERQVRRGLFDGRRQWEAHAEFMKPVEPILAPWIERFGYL